jgi:PAS domain S-box-containing protein
MRAMDAGFQFGWLNDSRLASQALSPTPVWLWSTQPLRMLWANPVGASIFDAPPPPVAAALEFPPEDGAARQIARLATTLPAGGSPRLERLRGFGASFGGSTVCLCSRIALEDGHAAVLVVATEQPAKGLVLPERVHRLLADLQVPSAVFAADGELIEAQHAALPLVEGKRDLPSLGASELAREASESGRAQGEIGGRKAAFVKLGAGPTFALLLGFAQEESKPDEAPRHEPVPASAAILDTLQPTRRQSFRFVWQMDSELRFVLGAAEFARLLGPKTASLLEQPWPEAAAELGIDADGRVAQALAARETWSGIVVEWPVDGLDGRLPIEMSGLPAFDRDRQFTGFRGFGICRDMNRLAELQRIRLEAQSGRGEGEAQPATRAENDEPVDNILPFPLPPPPEAAAAQTTQAEQSGPALQPELSPGDHSAFQELARELSQRLKNSPAPDPSLAEKAATEAPAPPAAAPAESDVRPRAQDTRAILDRIPIGILVYRLNRLLYGNRAFLDWCGYPDLDALAEAGGLDTLFIEPGEASGVDDSGSKPLVIATGEGDKKPVSGRLFSASWNGESALVLMIETQAAAAPAPAASPQPAFSETELHELKAQSAELQQARERQNALQSDNSELRAVLDTATDGVLLFDRSGAVLTANRSAEALFGYEKSELAGMPLGDLFAVESRRAVVEALERLARSEGALDSGQEAIGRVRQGGLVPLHITMGRIEGGEKFCAVLRDITAWKRTEEELIAARRQAERASTTKSEFLAKMSHEIRTPLNAIIGFSEVMMDERFGPIGNDRYREYLKDIHASGGQLIALLNDLLDLSKIETGKLDLNFVTVNLNDIVQQCVAVTQQEANRQRVIVRTALNPSLPPIVADARSVRQIALNILSNSVKLTSAGGQVIVSTAVNDEQEVSLRIRDTASGMTEKELQNALQPFSQLATTSRWGASGTGLALPITKALAEANHARFRIFSGVDAGTLVEVAFPATRVLAG